MIIFNEFNFNKIFFIRYLTIQWTLNKNDFFSAGWIIYDRHICSPYCPIKTITLTQIKSILNNIAIVM